MLSRCIATDPQIFAAEYWGRRPLLSRSDALPRDFSDLLSADTVDELIAERGVRAPFIRLAKEGDVLARDCYLGPAGFGAEMPDQVDSAKVLSQFASGATIVLQGLHRLWPPLIDFVRQAWSTISATPCRRTPTSRRPAVAASIRTTTSTTSSSCRRPGRSGGSCTSPCTTIPCRRSRGHEHRAAIARARHRRTGHRHRAVGRATRCICRADGCIRRRRLETTSIHLTIGVSATDRSRRRTRGRRPAGDDRRVQEVAADGQRPDRSG